MVFYIYSRFLVGLILIPTNNKIPNEEYIILGYGRDYLDISPLKGVVQSSGNSSLGVKS